MTGLVARLGERLLAMEPRIHHTFVPFREYMSPAYQARLRLGIVSHYEAKDIATLVKEAALEAGALELAGIAETVLARCRHIASCSFDEKDDPSGAPELWGVQYYKDWEPHAARVQSRELERGAREARWHQLERVTTSDITERVEPRWFSTTQIFGLLKRLGLLRGGPGEYELTAKGETLGESIEKGPTKRRYIYWKKEVFDLVQKEIERIREQNGGTISLASSRNVPDPGAEERAPD